MKEYPSIQGPSKAPRDQGIAFYKYDGSNLRWEWQKKNGWCKYGTRHRLFDETDEVFGEAIKLFKETVAPQIDPILRKEYRDAQIITVYTEFFGDKSFAGQHVKDDPKKLILFDVEIYKKGFISPREFVKNFSCKLDMAAKVVYEGNLNDEFIRQVRKNEFNPPLNEGVVFKGGSGHKLWMTKIKTEQYLTKLKEAFGVKWVEYGE